MTTDDYGAGMPEQNTVGLVGFIISLAALVFSAGILSPVGMIVSLVGLSKTPRGFAIAGVVLGVIGTLFLFLWVLLVITVFSIGAIAVVMFLLISEFGIMWIETGFDAFKISEAIVAYEDENGSLPASVSDLTLEEGLLIDYWGNPYTVQIDKVDRQLDIRSFGEDGIENTDDDHHIKMSFSITSDDFEWEDWDDSTIIIGEDDED